jgi:hypothetical protein
MYGTQIKDLIDNLYMKMTDKLVITKTTAVATTVAMQTPLMDSTVLGSDSFSVVLYSLSPQVQPITLSLK